MTGYMYILECVDGSYYTGSTKNLEKRLWEHENLQGANYTRKKHPAKLVYVEEFSRIDDAFYREKQVQGWSHAKKKALIDANKESLIEFSKNYTQYPRIKVASALRLGSGTTSSATGHLPVTELVEVTGGSTSSATGLIASRLEPSPVTEPVEVTAHTKADND